MSDDVSTAELEEVREFSIARRGYDREQVHEHLEYINGRLLEERRHADEIDRQLRAAQAQLADHQPSFESLGKEAARLFEEAGRIAESLRAHAQQEAAATNASAKSEAEALIQAAEKQARDTELQARRKLSHADDQVAQAEADIRASMEEAESQARERSDRTVAEARAQAAQIIAEAEERRDAIDAEVARLDTHRNQAVNQIRLLSERLGFVTQPGEEPAEGDRDDEQTSQSRRTGASADR